MHNLDDKRSHTIEIRSDIIRTCYVFIAPRATSASGLVWAETRNVHSHLGYCWGQCRRRWPNINSTLYKQFVFKQEAVAGFDKWSESPLPTAASHDCIH